MARKNKQVLSMPTRNTLKPPRSSNHLLVTVPLSNKFGGKSHHRFKFRVVRKVIDFFNCQVRSSKLQKIRKIIQMIFLVSCWFISSAWNGHNFNNKFASTTWVIKEIKTNVHSYGLKIEVIQIQLIEKLIIRDWFWYVHCLGVRVLGVLG